MAHIANIRDSRGENMNFKCPNRSFAAVVDEQPAGRVQLGLASFYLLRDVRDYIGFGHFVNHS